MKPRIVNDGAHHGMWKMNELDPGDNVVLLSQEDEPECFALGHTGLFAYMLALAERPRRSKDMCGIEFTGRLYRADPDDNPGRALGGRMDRGFAVCSIVAHPEAVLWVFAPGLLDSLTCGEVEAILAYVCG